MSANRLLVSLTIGSCLAMTACGPLPAPPALPDTTAPTLAEVTPVPNSAYMNATPSYTFSSTEAGTISFDGGCTSATTAASSGNNTIVLSALAVGYYKNCTVTVTDAVGNASTTLAISSFMVGKPYNDTGITKCGDMAYSYTGYTGSGTHNNDVDCAAGASPSSTATNQGFEIANGLDAVPAGQDAHFGRDADATKNSDSDGRKGFSFTKLSAADGSVLAIQNGTWSDSGSEAAGTQWGCVQDNVTGLVWEVKTNDGGLRDKDWTYSWYSTDNTNNGGNAGTSDAGNNCAPDIARCDTAKYVADVNAGALCGKSGWRLPVADELLSVFSNANSGPAIDQNFLPNITNYIWSSSSSYNSSQAWSIDSYNGLLENAQNKNSSFNLVLVHN